MTRVIDVGQRIGLDLLGEILEGRFPRLELSDSTRAQLVESRELLVSLARGERAVYGVNTGFGKLSGVRIDSSDLTDLQRNLIRSHACGVGEPLPRPVVAISLLLRIRALARGRSGVRPELLDRLLDLFNRGAFPVVPSQGSVGASGDLAPLAHLALGLLVEGEVDTGDGPRPAEEVLGALPGFPVRLEEKEGLALINGTQVSTALLAQALLEAERLAESADAIAAVSLEALRGSVAPFDEKIHAVRPHPGQQRVAANLRELLSDSEIVRSHRDCPRVQDNYSLRCIPQVHGASRDWFQFIRGVVEIEVDSVTDNPLVFAESGEAISGGNFHGQPLALGADALKVAVAELGTISERRIDYLVNPDQSGLPPFLAARVGLESGLMIPQVVAASLANENKVLCHPASVDSIPTSGGKEDHVAFAPAAARQALQIVANVRRILAIELLAACVGLDLETDLAPGRGVAALHRAVRQRVEPLDGDRPLTADIEELSDWIGAGGVIRAVEVGDDTNR